MNRNLKQNEINIYTCYHNLNVLVLYDNNTLKILEENKICLYIFEDDTSPFNCYTKLLSFAQFIEEVKKQGYEYINYYYNGEDWCWHIDAVDAFKKEAMDKFLNSLTKEEKKKFDYLQKYQ